MKTIKRLIWLLILGVLVAQCDKVSYRKTKSGLVYQIYPGGGNDSLIHNGQVVKFQVTTSLNDSVMYSSYDKMSAFARCMPSEKSDYNLLAVFPLLRKGDSAVIVQAVDSLMRQGTQLPPAAKKGDRITTRVRILEVYSKDSLAMLDYNKEMAKDRPRQMKEQQDEMKKVQAERLASMDKEDKELESNGEISKELNTIETYLSNKKISAKKIGKGVYITVEKPGSGPLAAQGKYVNVRYIGKLLSTDSTFQSNTYEFPLGVGSVIRGWDEGIEAMNLGTRATLYIPGFLAYGANPPQGSPFKPFESLKFEVELLNISDTPTVKRPMQ